MSAPLLSERQRAIYSFIVRYMGLHGTSPTIRAICDEFDFASSNGAYVHLKVLERAGLITKSGGKRGFVPVVKEGHCPCCGQALPSEVVPGPGINDA